MILCSLIYRFCITVLDALETTPFVDQQDNLPKRSVEKISEEGISRAKVSIKFKFQRVIFFVFHHVSIHFR